MTHMFWDGIANVEVDDAYRAEAAALGHPAAHDIEDAMIDMIDAIDPDDGLRAAFVAQIAAERAVAGHTYKSLAAAAGVAERTLMRYLTSQRDIPLTVQIKIARGLGLTMTTLWHRAEERHRYALTTPPTFS